MADGQVYEIVLSAKGCSGRGVRFRELTAPEVDEVASDAFKLLSGAEPTVAQYRQAETSEGIKRMLVAVTKKGGLTPETVRQVKPEDWEPLNFQKLGQDNSPLRYDRLFPKPKDHAVLSALFAQYHKVTQQELDDIAGKALAVSEG